MYVPFLSCFFCLCTHGSPFGCLVPSCLPSKPAQGDSPLCCMTLLCLLWLFHLFLCIVVIYLQGCVPSQTVSLRVDHAHFIAPPLPIPLFFFHNCLEKSQPNLNLTIYFHYVSMRAKCWREREIARWKPQSFSNSISE